LGYLLLDEEVSYSIAANISADQRLLNQLALIDSLPPEDKNIIASLIDAFVKRQQI
jgi:hypothetical protein